MRESGVASLPGVLRGVLQLLLPRRIPAGMRCGDVAPSAMWGSGGTGPTAAAVSTTGGELRRCRLARLARASVSACCARTVRQISRASTCRAVQERSGGTIRIATFSDQRRHKAHGSTAHAKGTRCCPRPCIQALPLLPFRPRSLTIAASSTAALPSVHQGLGGSQAASPSAAPPQHASPALSSHSPSVQERMDPLEEDPELEMRAQLPRVLSPPALARPRLAPLLPGTRPSTSAES